VYVYWYYVAAVSYVYIFIVLDERPVAADCALGVYPVRFYSSELVTTVESTAKSAVDTAPPVAHNWPDRGPSSAGEV
jgi:hypothetical protein